MSEIPVEVSMHAERLYDEGGNESVPMIITKAILSERERSVAILKSIEPMNSSESHLIETIVRRIRGNE